MSRQAIARCGLLIIILILSAACQRTATLENDTEQTAGKIDSGSASEMGPEAAEEIKQPVTLNINFGGDPLTFDPALAHYGLSVGFSVELFVGLTRTDPETAEPIPYLATYWEAGEDGKGNQTWTFYLRDDIAWVRHDPETRLTTQEVDEEGHPRFVNAYDVVYGVKRAIDPATASDYAHVLYSIKNAEAVNSGVDGATLDQVGVQALDDSTVQFTMEYPAGFFPGITALWVAYPVPRWTIEAYGDNWADIDHIVTSGPYVVDSWIQGTELNLVKNPRWADANSVQIDRIEGVMIDDPTLSLLMYEKGELDLVGVTMPALEAMKGDPTLQSEFHSWPVLATTYLGFANNKYPFDDPRVRRAFTQAFDRQSLIDNFLLGGEILATTFAPPGVFGAPEPGTVGLHYDPQTARDTLQEYLDEKGITVEQFSELNITILVPATESMVAGAQIAQQMWKDVLGVEVQVQTLEPGTYYQTLDKSTSVNQISHIFVQGWIADYPDENNWVLEVFHSQLGINWVRRNCLDETCQETVTTEFDELTMRARESQDPEERKQLYREAERILTEVEAAIAPLYHDEAAIFMKPWLSRPFSSMGISSFMDWSIDWEAKQAALVAQS